MTSFIINSRSLELQEQRLLAICNSLNIDSLDRTYIKGDKESSLGIELIKKLQEKIFFKPLRGQDKAVIIPQSELLTIPAQNALLKLLEEPPNHTFIFLLSTNTEVFLPTILSRCQIINIKEVDASFSVDEKQEVKDSFNKWNNQSLGDALKQAEILAKDKTKTLQILERYIIIGENILRNDVINQKYLAPQLKKLQQTYTILKTTNTNPRLSLEHLFLSFLDNN